MTGSETRCAARWAGLSNAVGPSQKTGVLRSMNSLHTLKYPFARHARAEILFIAFAQ